jgi:hypothetical protein
LPGQDKAFVIAKHKGQQSPFFARRTMQLGQFSHLGAHAHKLLGRVITDSVGPIEKEYLEKVQDTRPLCLRIVHKQTQPTEAFQWYILICPALQRFERCLLG